MTPSPADRVHPANRLLDRREVNHALSRFPEPEIDAELANQIQALVKGDAKPAAVGKAIQAVADQLRSSGRSYYP